MARIEWKNRLTAASVAEHVIDRIGDKKLKKAKDTCKGDELRIWIKMHINLYGQPEASEQMKNRAVTKVIEYMHSDL